PNTARDEGAGAFEAVKASCVMSGAGTLGRPSLQPSDEYPVCHELCDNPCPTFTEMRVVIKGRRILGNERCEIVAFQTQLPTTAQKHLVVGIHSPRQIPCRRITFEIRQLPDPAEVQQSFLTGR